MQITLPFCDQHTETIQITARDSLPFLSHRCKLLQEKSNATSNSTLHRRKKLRKNVLFCFVVNKMQVLFFSWIFINKLLLMLLAPCFCCWDESSQLPTALAFLLQKDMVYKSSISIKEKHLLGVWSNQLAELSSRLTAAGQPCPTSHASWRPKWICKNCFLVDS